MAESTQIGGGWTEINAARPIVSLGKIGNARKSHLRRTIIFHFLMPREITSWGHTSTSVLLRSCRQQCKSGRWVARRCEAKRKNERLGVGGELGGREEAFLLYCLMKAENKLARQTQGQMRRNASLLSVGESTAVVHNGNGREQRTTEMSKFDRIGLLCFICP